MSLRRKKKKILTYSRLRRNSQADFLRLSRDFIWYNLQHLPGSEEVGLQRAGGDLALVRRRWLRVEIHLEIYCEIYRLLEFIFPLRVEILLETYRLLEFIFPLCLKIHLKIYCSLEFIRCV